MYSTGKWWMWLGFIAFVVLVIAIDLFLLGRRKAHRVSAREASAWIAVWVSCALIFNILLWWYVEKTEGSVIATEKALQFFSGYLIEQSLSLDNMFAFIMIFKYFAVPEKYQRRVLIYGVLGAIVLRLLIILSGTWLVSELHWILYIFGVFLVYSGYKMLSPPKEELSLENNFFIKWLQRHIRITHVMHEEKFFVKHNALWYATPLFLVLILIEISDVVFALDSIPAIFAITNDAFIIFTSNIFAILGLRALYFLLCHLANQFHLLHYGIAAILIFMGLEMLIEPWIKIPIVIALGVLVLILGTTVLLSVIYRPHKGRMS